MLRYQSSLLNESAGLLCQDAFVSQPDFLVTKQKLLSHWEKQSIYQKTSVWTLRWQKWPSTTIFTTLLFNFKFLPISTWLKEQFLKIVTFSEWYYQGQFKVPLKIFVKCDYEKGFENCSLIELCLVDLTVKKLEPNLKFMLNIHPKVICPKRVLQQRATHQASTLL